MTREVLVRPKTDDARDLLDSLGEIWNVVEIRSDPVYGSKKKLHLEKRVDKGQRTSVERMWVDYPVDDMYTIVWR